MKYNNVIWDWNGTIVNDVWIALDAVNGMLQEKRSEPIDIAQYRRAMDTPIFNFYKQFFDMKRTSFEWITSFFQEYYAAHQDALFLHEGIQELLSYFQEQECRQLVLSSSQTDIIEGYARQFGIRCYFEEILGADDFLSESKIQRAVEYCASQGISLKETILVGDTVHDFEVASELGVTCVLLACGHQDRASLAECGCPVYQDVIQFKDTLLS